MRQDLPPPKRSTNKIPQWAPRRRIKVGSLALELLGWFAIIGLAFTIGYILASTGLRLIPYVSSQ